MPPALCRQRRTITCSGCSGGDGAQRFGGDVKQQPSVTVLLYQAMA
ncbi:MAG: hypothetical protein QOI13_2872, partial [Paraburkholderia sp.]|nr:hypothetical protein [Paraburkholderia sp.]